MQQFDVIVVGAGPGGYVAAIRASQLGFKTLCIEKNERLGGVCLNVGCIPSKALLQATETYAHLRKESRLFGLDSTPFQLNFDEMMKHKNSVVAGLTDGIRSLFKKYGVEVLRGEAKVLSPETIEVKGEETTQIQGKHILLATGSQPFSLPFLPFDEMKVLSSTGALSLSAPPESLAVIGAGIIGVELASVYSRLGTKVILVEMLEKICGSLDSAIHSSYLQILKKQGLEFHLESTVLDAEIKNNGIALNVKKGSDSFQLFAEKVLVCIGRRPCTEGLEIESLGLERSAKGEIIVDDEFRTNISSIYAIGDLIQGPMLAHRASEEGVVWAERLAGQKVQIDYISIPSIIYTHPEVATVGFTEEEAKKLGLETISGICSLKAVPRARVSNDTDGMIKVIGDKSSGRLLGMHLLAPHASELIQEGVTALTSRMTLEELGEMSHGHPTLSEGIKEACLIALGKPINV